MALMEKKGRISTTVIMRVLRVDCVSNNPAYKPTKYALYVENNTTGIAMPHICLYVVV